MVRQLKRFEGSNPSAKKQIHLFRTPLPKILRASAGFFLIHLFTFPSLSPCAGFLEVRSKSEEAKGRKKPTGAEKRLSLRERFQFMPRCKIAALNDSQGDCQSAPGCPQATDPTASKIIELLF